MSDLITHLRSFNRKERFILLQEALGADEGDTGSHPRALAPDTTALPHQASRAQPESSPRARAHDRILIHLRP